MCDSAKHGWELDSTTSYGCWIGLHYVSSAPYNWEWNDGTNTDMGFAGDNGRTPEGEPWGQGGISGQTDGRCGFMCALQFDGEYKWMDWSCGEEVAHALCSVSQGPGPLPEMNALPVAATVVIVLCTVL